MVEKFGCACRVFGVHLRTNTTTFADVAGDLYSILHDKVVDVSETTRFVALRQAGLFYMESPEQ